MAFRYLSKNVLAGFEKYKYNSRDTSPLSIYVMNPFWNWLVEFYPLWIAPNLLTCSGFSLIVSTLAIFIYFDVDFHASDDLRPDRPPVPEIVFLIAAVSIFLAHQLDGTDGKQARRTGSNTPLGELMDHGLDSWSSVIMPICIYSAFGRGDSGLSPIRLYWVVLSVTLMFFLSHWEKYNTGVLYLPWGYDLSQLGMTFLYLMTYIFGYKAWKTQLPILGTTMPHLFEIFVHLSIWGSGIPTCFWNVYKSYRDGTGNNLSFYESVRPVLPLIFEYCIFTIWVFLSPTDILNTYPRILLLTLGTIYSNITCRCIISGMSKTRAELFNMLLLPLPFILAILVSYDWFKYIESYLLFAYFLLAMGSHLHYGYHVVKELADHYKINVFSISKRASNSDKK